MSKNTNNAGLTSRWKRTPSPADTRNDESRGGYTTLVCLNDTHHEPVEYTVTKDDPNTCPDCGRGN